MAPDTLYIRNMALFGSSADICSWVSSACAAKHRMLLSGVSSISGNVTFHSRLFISLHFLSWCSQNQNRDGTSLRNSLLSSEHSLDSYFVQLTQPWSSFLCLASYPNFISTCCMLTRISISCVRVIIPPRKPFIILHFPGCPNFFFITPCSSHLKKKKQNSIL